MVPQSELDAAEATLKQNKANADNVRATIEKKTLRAPFAGRLGIRLVNLGQYLDAGKPIVSLQSLAPIYADFSLPQQELARLKTGMRVHVTTDAYPGRTFEGKLTAINPELDAQTRERFAGAITVYLRYCEDYHEMASVAGAKRYLDAGIHCGPFARPALHWFFVAARRRQDAGLPTRLGPAIVEAPVPDRLGIDVVERDAFWGLPDAIL